MIAWRLCARRYSGREDVLSGEGAKEFGGRWNETGLRLIYASSNASLALLEQLVHMSPARIPKDLVAVQIVIPPDTPGTVLNAEQLPATWRELNNPDCIRIGSDWIRSANQLWLEVPSAVNPLERNILLNPEHPDIAPCVVMEPIPIVYDPRIIERFATPKPKRKSTEERVRRRLMGHNE